MGEVYRVHDNKLKRDIALKVLPTSLAGHPERQRRFECEAAVIAALKRPNMAPIMIAPEPRIKAGIVVVAGILFHESLPEVEPMQ